MLLIRVLIVAFGFVDILTNFKVTNISAAAIEWMFLGFCALCFVILNGGGRHLVVHNKWFVALSIFTTLNAFRSTNYASAIVDVIYITIPLLFWTVAYRSVVGDRRVAQTMSWMLVSVWLPFLIIVLSVTFGVLEYVEGLGPRTIIGMRSAALMVLPIVAVSVSVSIFGDKFLSRRLLPHSVLALVIGNGVIFGTLSRTSILCVFVYALLVSLLRLKGRALAFSICTGALVVFAVSTIPPLKERVVPDDMSVAELVESGAYTGGRTLIWAALLEGSADVTLLGHGTGSAKPYVAELFPESAGIPHNEYLRNLFDGGVVGLSLVALAWITRIVRYYRLARSAIRRNEYYGATLFVGALLSATGVAVSGIFDNAFLYVFLTGNAFILFGVADRHKDGGDEARTRAGFPQ